MDGNNSNYQQSHPGSNQMEKKWKHNLHVIYYNNVYVLHFNDQHLQNNYLTKYYTDCLSHIDLPVVRDFYPWYVTSVEIGPGPEDILTAILIRVGELSVTREIMCILIILANRLGSLTRNSVTDSRYMTEILLLSQTKHIYWQYCILILTVPGRYFCCGSLLLLVLAVRVYTLVRLLC